jgi:hypothetical protein
MEDITEKAIRQAYSLGHDTGENHAEWVAQDTFGGRARGSHSDSLRSARAILKMIDDGDPQVWEGTPNLSGKWAGSTTDVSLCNDLKVYLEANREQSQQIDDAQDEIAESWLCGVSNGYIHKLENLARFLVED